MDLPPPPPDPPAITVSVEQDADLAAIVESQQRFARLLGPTREGFQPVMLTEQATETTQFVSQPVEEGIDPLVSNRPENHKTSVVYINGIQTSRSDARKATSLVRSSLGVEQEDVSLLYNPPEPNRALSILKVGAGMISSRLSNHNEPECSAALKTRVESALRNSDERLIIVTHSHGSQIAASVLDAVYDDFQETARGRKLWRENAQNIEVLMYAPLVRSLPAGIDGVGLSNKLDLPARGAGRVARGMSALKDVTGWRDHELIRHIKYSPTENRFPDLVFNPESVHSSFNLIFDNVYFNIQLLGQNPSTGKVSPTMLANNLAKSIREGRRSDSLHLETIVQACDAYGSRFSRPFLRHVRVDAETGAGAIEKFTLVPERMARLYR